MNPEIKIAEPQLSGAALPVETPDLLAREEEVSGRAFRGGDISGLACDHLAVTGCSFTGCRLAGAEFFGTRLRGISLADSDIRGIRIREISSVELNGLKVNALQACDLARLLGIKIED